MRFITSKKFFDIVFLFFVFVCVSACSKKEGQVFYRIESLDSCLWENSEWISVVDAPIVRGRVRGSTRAADGASWFVTKVKNRNSVKKAVWMTTALGIFDIYVNGKPIGDEILRPGFTHYSKTRLSFTYDVTNAFNTESGMENILSAQVTPGWWADKIITPNRNDGMIGEKCAFRSVLELTYIDGKKEYLGTNTEEWKAGIAGPVTHAAIFDGEEYDAQIPLGHENLEKLSKPEVNEEYKGKILPSKGAEVYFRHDLAMRPVRAYIWEGLTNCDDENFGKVIIKKEFSSGESIYIRKGENLVVDFGQNCSAVPSFVFKSEKGTLLTCLPSELLNDSLGAKSRGMDGPEGSVHRLNLRIPDHGMILKYTFDGTSDFVSFCPRNTFFGYRFLSISATNDVVIKTIESIPVTSITKEMETGTITTGNDLINRLISNTVWGMRSNYLSIPTDCPQRNERLGWTADTHVFAETGAFFANTSSFMQKWIRDLIDSQSESGAFPSVAPLGQYGRELMRVGWADAGIIVPWVIWKQFGNTEIIDYSWDAMVKYINHVSETHYDHNELKDENRNYQYGDWLSYEPLESWGGTAFTNASKDKRVPLKEAVDYWNYLGASYWLIDANMMRDMAVATGRDAGHFNDMIVAAKKYIKDKFFTSDGEFRTEILNSMQTPALFALKNNILNGSAKFNMIARLRENFARHDNCLQTGFLGTSILMPTLTENGMSDIAWNLLFQRKNPSWLYSVDNGATTIWERWNSYMIEKGMGPRGMNSFNHYAYGVVCEWIWESVAGISSSITAPGFKHIVMKPIPDRRLKFIDAVYKSTAGIIKSSWKYDGEDWIWTFSIPQGSKAFVTIPGENGVKKYESGTYTIIRKLGL